MSVQREVGGGGGVPGDDGGQGGVGEAGWDVVDDWAAVTVVMEHNPRHSLGHLCQAVPACGEECWDTAQHLVEVGSEPGAHPVVDDGIDTGVGHGQPVEEEVDVADVLGLGDGRVVVYQDEVDVVWSPAHHED